MSLRLQCNNSKSGLKRHYSALMPRYWHQTSSNFVIKWCSSTVVPPRSCYSAWIVWTMTICVVSMDVAESAGISSCSNVTLVASVTSEGLSGDAHMRAISPWWSMGMLRGRASAVSSSTTVGGKEEICLWSSLKLQQINQNVTVTVNCVYVYEY